MALSKQDKKDIAEMVALTLKGIKSAKADNTTPEKPKTLLSAKDRPKVLKGLTPKQLKDIWGELNKNNLFANRYKASRKLYKQLNVSGRPNIRYSEAYQYFIVPLAKTNKYTDKQMKEIKKLAISQMKDKIANQNHPKALEWLNKSLEEIKGL